MPKDQATIIVDSIHADFPSEARLFDVSLASSLLSSLSLYFWSLDYPSSSLVDCHKAVDLARPVLKALSNEDVFVDDNMTVEEFVDAMDIGEDEFFMKKRQTQKDRKKNRRAVRSSVSVDTKPFQQLGISVPLTRAQARQQALQILQDQKRILLVCSTFSHLSFASTISCM